ncbi:LOW QUALITY PROTEIN: hsp70 family chaperone [Colletotrichum tofieldiae]|nr:LOW QUALITY PROTEIN: hsp70 family chaperone [Colletotrichum tofieldiae]
MKSSPPWLTSSLPNRTKPAFSSDDGNYSSEEEEEEEGDDVLVIGVDFGTTYSGVAWATGADFASDQINVITSWPGTGREEGKAPTELFYEDGQMTWGYDIPDDADPVRWFKLLLLKEEDLDPELRSSEFLLRGRKMLRETGKTAIDLIADYLRALSNHVIHVINKSRGESVIDAMRFHIVITVPAIWKGYARQGMEDAAKKSGILDNRPAGKTTLTFAPEPEAAALSTLCEPGRKTKKGEVYIICDAGGGTVDLISYEINKVNPINMREAVEGTASFIQQDELSLIALLLGGLCGGIFIDESFERACKTRLGRKWDQLSRAGIKKIMKGEWETAIKPQFKPLSANKEYVVEIPAEAFRKSSLDDTSREPIIKNGKIHFKDRTAICRGAVYKGFLDGLGVSEGALTQPNGRIIEAPIKVTSTVSRASYGVNYRTKFDKKLHIAEDKEWDADEGMWKAKNQMEWYLKRGENVSKMDPVRHEFYKLCTEDFSGSLSIELYECEEADPPSRCTSDVNSMCSFSFELDIPYSKLPDFKKADGGNAKKLEYDLEMIPSGASIEFVVYIDGRKMGSRNANIRFE